LSTVSDFAPCGIDMVIHGRTSSLMPSGVSTRAHTSSAGASTTLCRSMIMTVQGIPPDRGVGRSVFGRTADTLTAGVPGRLVGNR
jgi:hypothetical protein